MSSSQGTRKDSSQSRRKDSSHNTRKNLASALDRVAIVLIGVYVVLFIAAAIPPQIKDPRWATLILDSLRAMAFLPLIGGVLILLANHMDPSSIIITKHRQWVRKSAPLAALGFFLLIPLQGLVSYGMIKAANGEAMQKIASLTRAMAMIRDAQDEDALRSGINAIGINAIGIQDLPQGKLAVPLATVKQQIFPQLGPEIQKLTNQTDNQRQKALQESIIRWMRDGALALLYGLGFKGLSRRGEQDGMVANPAVGANRDINNRH